MLHERPVESNGLGCGEHVVGLSARVGRGSNRGDDTVNIHGDYCHLNWILARLKRLRHFH